jgi:hypothetical protein
MTSPGTHWQEQSIGCRQRVDVARMDIRRLRAAIQNHEISFPSPVPVFPCQSRADIQWRLAELYLIHNWSCPELGERYALTLERVRQLITQWVRRAAVLGYLQEIVAGAQSASGLPKRKMEWITPESVRGPLVMERAHAATPQG